MPLVEAILRVQVEVDDVARDGADAAWSAIKDSAVNELVFEIEGQLCSPTYVVGYARLSARQRQVAHLVAQGMANREIGEALGMESRTVKAHVASVCERLGVRDRVGIAVILTQAELRQTQEDARHDRKPATAAVND